MSCASWHVGGWLPCQRGVAAVVDDCGGPLTCVFLFDAAGLCALFLRIVASLSILCPPSHCCSIINRTVQCAECLTMLEERMNDLYEYAGPLQPEELHCVVTPDCLGLVGGGGGKGGRGRTCPASEQRVKVRMMLGGEVGWARARWDGRHRVGDAFTSGTPRVGMGSGFTLRSESGLPTSGFASQAVGCYS